jgi:death on curing protein
VTSGIEHLRVEDILRIAEELLPEVVIRDAGVIASAAARPHTTVFGEAAYPTLTLRAAALLHSLVRGHALLDGNKRLAWASARVMLLMNDVELSYDIDEAEAMMLAAAQGDIDVAEIAAQIKAWMN